MTFSVTAGASEEPRIPLLFPKAKLITTTGQVTLGAEPVRAKRAQVWMSGDSDVILFAKRNSSWAAVVDPENPIDRRPNTWAVRYGDDEWKQFLDFWAAFLTANGEVEGSSSITWRSSARRNVERRPGACPAGTCSDLERASMIIDCHAHVFQNWQGRLRPSLHRDPSQVPPEGGDAPGGAGLSRARRRRGQAATCCSAPTTTPGPG